jgi:hypothetical protein
MTTYELYKQLVKQQKKRQWKEANTTLTALQEAYQLEATETSTEEETVS